MIVGHINDLKGTPVVSEAVKNISKQVLVSPTEGWDGYVMRVFTIGDDGHTPKHRHAWPHINWVIAGEGILHLEGTDYPLKEGSYAYVPSDALHQFTNPGSEPLRFICIVPEEGDV
ncbi:MAG: cupin domain-containing protein [Firmicutes bacterium]|nr:cupin domain-containing protein [Bacillota bacterium]